MPGCDARGAQTGMTGLRERGSKIQRPWSVYRANTFELSDEMIGLALAGTGEPGGCHYLEMWS